MSKPIFVVRVPRRYIMDDTFRTALQQTRDELLDYHVIAAINERTDEMEFECYNAVDATEATIQEIQDKIFEILNQNETL